MSAWLLNVDNYGWLLKFVKNEEYVWWFVFDSDEESNEVDLSTSEDWDVKTVTSTLKLYLR